MQKRDDELYELVCGTVEGMGFQLVTVEDTVEHGRRVFRFYIDHPGGVVVEDCASVSREIDYLLDARFDFDGSYVLEVSSPGLDHQLKHEREYAHFVGRRARAVVRARAGERSVVEGVLVETGPDGVRIQGDDGTETTLSYSEIARASLLP